MGLPTSGQRNREGEPVNIALPEDRNFMVRFDSIGDATGMTRFLRYFQCLAAGAPKRRIFRWTGMIFFGNGNDGHVVDGWIVGRSDSRTGMSGG